MHYPRSLAVTWQTTLDRLGAGEVALLRLLAWLAPDPVPLLEGEAAEGIWLEAIVLVRQEIPEVRETAGEVRATLTTLANYSLLRWDPASETIAVHRVVQEILRTRLPEPGRREWLTSACGSGRRGNRKSQRRPNLAALEPLCTHIACPSRRGGSGWALANQRPG